MSRFTKIEEIAMLQNDSPHDDFAAHFYLTRYDRLKGLLMTTPENLRTAAKKAIGDSIAKNQCDLAVLSDDGKDAMAWSMNWYRLRTKDNKTYQLAEEEKNKITGDFQELSKASPLKTQIHIFQREGSDTCLIAVSLMLDTSNS
jgi:hypothetical protein